MNPQFQAIKKQLLEVLHKADKVDASLDEYKEALSDIRDEIEV